MKDEPEEYGHPERLVVLVPLLSFVVVVFGWLLWWGFFS